MKTSQFKSNHNDGKPTNLFIKYKYYGTATTTNGNTGGDV